jgi:hypothetical protein
MKTLRHAINIACFAVIAVCYVAGKSIEWAMDRVDRLSFGDGPNTIKETIEGLLIWVVVFVILKTAGWL